MLFIFFVASVYHYEEREMGEGDSMGIQRKQVFWLLSAVLVPLLLSFRSSDLWYPPLSPFGFLPVSKK
jgi:hypothetical protein